MEERDYEREFEKTTEPVIQHYIAWFENEFIDRPYDKRR